jgi:hypothetical protein
MKLRKPNPTPSETIIKKSKNKIESIP